MKQSENLPKTEKNTKEIDEKPVSKAVSKPAKAKNSNPYENLYLIWQVLRDHASAEHPMNAKAIFQILSQNKAYYPSENTISTLLEERRPLMGELFPHIVMPSESTVQKFLRQQAESPLLVEGTTKLCCVAKRNGKFMDYDQASEKHSKEKGGNTSSQSGLKRYYYLSSPLSQGEWRVLTDLLQFSPWISQAQTSHFLEVLQQFGAEEFVAEQLSYPFKREHKELFQLIHSLHQGISGKQKVKIHYGTHVLKQNVRGQLQPQLVQRQKNGEMILSPLSLVWANGLYYLLAEQKENLIMHLRVDRILSVALTGEEFSPPTGFSPLEHRDRAPIMYGGKATYIRFRCSAELLNTVLDFFSGTAQYKLLGEDMEVQLTASTEGVKLFALQYVHLVEILEPPSLREEIGKILENSLEKYQTPL